MSGSSMSVTSSLPEGEYVSEQVMRDVSKMLVTDSRGNKVPFGTIFEYERTVVVFIRES